MSKQSLNILNYDDGIDKINDILEKKLSNFDTIINNMQSQILYLKKILTIINNKNLFPCSICFNDINILGLTDCFHIYCMDCLIQLLKTENKCCALCRKDISFDNCFFISKNNNTII